MTVSQLLPTIDPAFVARLAVVAIIAVVALVTYLLAKGAGA